MATAQELAQSALEHAKKTSWSFDKWLNEIHTNPAYLYKSTEWYKAGLDLNAGKTAPPGPSTGSGPADAQARMFLAGNPLDCLQAPDHLIPVLSADYGNYRSEELSSDELVNAWLTDVIAQLSRRFSFVEAWCDCRIEGTPYAVAVAMVKTFNLDGTAWGQCETAAEFDNGYKSGARRMIGQLAGLREDQKILIGPSPSDVHLAFELYRNVMPWQVPDYEMQSLGVGGNAIACYASSTEGAVYTPVSDYKTLGYYASGKDSVYGVGLLPGDWAAL